jgi:dienelactone hydrolase
MLLSLCLTAFAVPAPAAAALTPSPVLFSTESERATIKPVRLIAEDKVELSATYYAPKKMKIKNPAVILIHDSGQDQDQLKTLAENYQKKGFAALTIDLRGHGKSATKNLDWKTADEAGQKSMWAHAPKDIAAAADWLGERLEVHASNLTVLGIGSAVGLAARHAVEDKSTRSLVLVDPSQEMYGFDMAKDLAELAGLPTLIVAPKGERKKAAAIQKAAHEANDGYEYVEISVLKSKREDILGDKRLNASATSWTRDKVTKKD